MTERKKFILRFVAWVFLAFVIPASFLAWRFQLFEVTEEARVKVGGWGLILIIFTAVFFLSLFNQLRKGMKPSIAKQVADGICRITIPLVLCTFEYRRNAVIRRKYFQEMLPRSELFL